MKSIFFILAIISSMGLTPCYADVCQYKFGSVSCGYGTVENVTANGTAILNGTTVTNQLNVNGELTAIHASINNIHCSGSCILSESTFSSNTIISGILNATNSYFSQPLTLNSNASILNASKTADIIISIAGEKELNFLCLENNTHTGSITFSASTGIVYESGGSTALNVINGKIVQGSCPKN